MRAKGCTPNIVTSSSMACAGKAMLMTRELLNRLPSYGFQPDTVSYTTLLKGLCTSKRWDDVEQMTEHVCATNTTLCNIVRNSICKQGRVDDAFISFF